MLAAQTAPKSSIGDGDIGSRFVDTDRFPDVCAIRHSLVSFRWCEHKLQLARKQRNSHRMVATRF
jgi:hypothetical protein